MWSRIAGTLLLVAASLNAADAESLPYAGVWSGSIGKQKVQVCFSSTEDSQYYYLKHLRGIRLRAEASAEGKAAGAPSDWREGYFGPGSENKPSGNWKLVQSDPDTMTGEWQAPGAQGGQPIRLERIAGLEDEACGAAFYAPIKAAATQLTRGWQVFSLPGKYRGAAKFNAFVADWRRQSAVEDYECRMDFSNPMERELSPVLLTNNLLVVSEILFDVYCGGAHNSAHSQLLYFDPQTGEPLDTWAWIKGGNTAVEGRGEPKRLRKLIEGLADMDKECRQAPPDIGAPYPGKTGFNFPVNFIWALRSCNTEVQVPYDKLKPYLSSAGRSVAARFSSTSRTRHP